MIVTPKLLANLGNISNKDVVKIADAEDVENIPGIEYSNY